MRKSITIAFAMVMLFTVWLVAEKKDIRTGVQLQTTFDFNDYPVCGPTTKSNCIVAIQFYDATSHQILATKTIEHGMVGRQVISARMDSSSFPRKVYAATMYLDNSGRGRQGPRGQTSEYQDRGEH